MTIQRMTEADTAQIAAIEALLFSMPWSRQGFLDTIAMPNVRFLAAREGTEVVGYIGVYFASDEGEITNVAVSPSCQKCGIGTELLTELMLETKAEGVKRLVLEVRKSNEDAIHLYQKMGFEVCGTRKDFYEKPREDAYVMSKDQ